MFKNPKIDMGLGVGFGFLLLLLVIAPVTIPLRAGQISGEVTDLVPADFIADMGKRHILKCSQSRSSL
jgi:hypothetical protein